MHSRNTIYLLASEEAFAIYEGQGARSLRQIAHRSAGSLGDVDHGYRGEKTMGHTGPGGASFNVGANTGDADALERAAMARHAVEALERVWKAADAERIVLAAGPKMLGALRQAMPKALQEQVAGELHKNLMGLPEHELPAHLDAGA